MPYTQEEKDEFYGGQTRRMLKKDNVETVMIVMAFVIVLLLFLTWGHWP